MFDGATAITDISSYTNTAFFHLVCVRETKVQRFQITIIHCTPKIFLITTSKGTFSIKVESTPNLFCQFAGSLRAALSALHPAVGQRLSAPPLRLDHRRNARQSSQSQAHPERAVPVPVRRGHYGEQDAEFGRATGLLPDMVEVYRSAGDLLKSNFSYWHFCFCFNALLTLNN